MLPLFQLAWASIDHIQPVSAKRENTMENYVTACWKCNLKYGEKLVGKGKSKANKTIESNWDDFSDLCPILLRNASKKEDFWAKLLKNH